MSNHLVGNLLSTRTAPAGISNRGGGVYSPNAFRSASFMRECKPAPPSRKRSSSKKFHIFTAT
jgi:hypothetical protein